MNKNAKIDRQTEVSHKMLQLNRFYKQSWTHNEFIKFNEMNESQSKVKQMKLCIQPQNK